MKVNLKKFFVAVLLAVISCFEITNAEQPAAEQYRQMFKSGNFYVEYRTFREYKSGGVFGGNSEFSTPNLILAGKDGQRIMRENGGQVVYGKFFFPNYELANAYDDTGYISRIGNFGFYKLKDCPKVLYRDGKYYRFIAGSNSITGICLAEEKLNSPTLDPNEEWQFVKFDLSLPDELAVFYWNDLMRENIFNIPAPKYNGSSKLTVSNKEYDCDQYTNEIKSLAGNVIAVESYNMLYENGKLVLIQKYLVRDGKEYLSRTTEIKSITAEVPDKEFEIRKKIKVYAAQNGDMADMLEEKNLVETLGGK